MGYGLSFIVQVCKGKVAPKVRVFAARGQRETAIYAQRVSTPLKAKAVAKRGAGEGNVAICGGAFRGLKALKIKDHAAVEVRQMNPGRPQAP